MSTVESGETGTGIEVCLVYLFYMRAMYVHYSKECVVLIVRCKERPFV